MKHSRLLAVSSAFVLACAAFSSAQASIVWTFNLPGQTDSLSVITSGDAVGGVVANGKYSITDVIINSSSFFGSAVVGYSVSGGQLGMSTNGSPSEGGSTNAANNFIIWHGATNRFEINDLDANLAGTYASGSWLQVYFKNSLPGRTSSDGYVGDRSSYQLMSWFGGGPNQMFARLEGGGSAGGALAVGSLQPAEPATVPEPQTLALALMALSAAIVARRKRPGCSVA